MSSTTDEGPLGSLPSWARVGVLVAHPDDESFGLGALIDAFASQGSVVRVVCLTRGEASTLGDVHGDLAAIRADELDRAATALGVFGTQLLDFPDGELQGVPLPTLVAAASDGLDQVDGLLVFDDSGITGHPDHSRATEAAVALGRSHGIGVLAWALPEAVAARLRVDTGVEFLGVPWEAIDFEVAVTRERQLRAVHAHESQAVPGSAMWRRLELLGDREYLRWLVRPASG